MCGAPSAASVVEERSRGKVKGQEELNESESVSCSVLSNSLWPHGLQPPRLLCPWDSSGKNTGVGSHSFSRGYSQPRDGTWVSCIAGRLFTICTTMEAEVGSNVRLSASWEEAGTASVQELGSV